MMTDHEWNVIARKAFPAGSVKAPDFLWTRILSRIESEEARRSSVWWMQWRWMLKVTLALGLFSTVGSYYLYQQATVPLESTLERVMLEQTADLMTEIDS